MQSPDLSALVQTIPVAILVIRPDRTVDTVNAAAETLLQKSAKRMIGLPVTDVVSFEDTRIIEGLKKLDTDLAARGTSMRIGNHIRRNFGMTLTPFSQNEGWHLLMITATGTGQKLLSSERSSEQSVVRGPDILAHEIKNPLAAIKGAAQLLERTAEEGTKRLTGLIRSEVDRIAQLIDQMQSLTSRSKIPLGPCNIYEPLARACEIIETAHAGQIEILEEFDPSIPPVLGAQESLVQVLLNLMTNALEACADTNNPTITITTRFISGASLRLSREGMDAYVSLPVEIRISDNGPGISEDVVQDIFSPFVTTKKNGQGLGLALVQKLVHEMHGRIVYDRDEDAGLTHFRIFLTLAAQDESK
jgi:two-component system nitrogen regulation sensor histidine kinase GlnL